MAGKCIAVAKMHGQVCMRVCMHQLGLAYITYQVYRCLALKVGATAMSSATALHFMHEKDVAPARQTASPTPSL